MGVDDAGLPTSVMRCGAEMVGPLKVHRLLRLLRRVDYGRPLDLALPLMKVNLAIVALDSRHALVVLASNP